MTNELEKQFFDAFGLTYESCTDSFFNSCRFECDECPHREEKYLQISDNILLELLVIMTRYTDIIDGFDNVQELKEFVLKDLIYSLTQPECNIVKQQVRTIFEEG